MWHCSNIREDYEWAIIEYHPDMRYAPYQLSVKSKRFYHASYDNYKTLQGAKSAFSKNYQSPSWKMYPKPKWIETKKTIHLTPAPDKADKIE